MAGTTPTAGVTYVTLDITKNVVLYHKLLSSDPPPGGFLIRALAPYALPQNLASSVFGLFAIYVSSAAINPGQGFGGDNTITASNTPAGYDPTNRYSPLWPSASPRFTKADGTIVSPGSSSSSIYTYLDFSSLPAGTRHLDIRVDACTSRTASSEDTLYTNNFYYAHVYTEAAPTKPLPITPVLPSNREYLKLSLDPTTLKNTYNNQNVKVETLVDKICDVATLIVTNEDGTLLLSENYPTLGSGYTQTEGFTEYGFKYPASYALIDRETTFKPENAYSTRIISRIESGYMGSVLGFGDAGKLSAFALRVQGEIKATKTGVHKIAVRVDDGFFITFYDTNISAFATFDHWTGSAPTTYTTDNSGNPLEISLEAGERYWFSADFFEWGGERQFDVSWQIPGDTSYSIIPAFKTGIVRTIEKYVHNLINVRDAQTITAVLEMKNNDGTTVRKITKTLVIPDRTPAVINDINADLGFTIKPFEASKLKPGDTIRKANGEVLP